VILQADGIFARDLVVITQVSDVVVTLDIPGLREPQDADNPAEGQRGYWL